MLSVLRTKVKIKDKHARCFEHMNQNDHANDDDGIQIIKIDELPALRPDEWVDFFLLAHHWWWSHVPSRSLGWSLRLRIL